MHFDEMIDLKERLPASSGAAFATLFYANQAAGAAYAQISDNTRYLTDARRDAEKELARIQQTGSVVAPDGMRQSGGEFANRRVDELTQVITKRSAELDRLRTEIDQVDRRRLDVSTLLGNVANYLRDLPRGTRIIAANPAAIRKAGLNELHAQLAEVRNEIGNLDAEIEDIEDAPLPPAEMKKLARVQIAEMAAGANVELGQLSRGGRFTMGAGVWYDNLGGAELTQQLNAFVALVAPAELAAVLDARIDAAFDDAICLTGAERLEKLAVAVGALLKAERHEEALIRALEAAGQVVSRRPDADPRAVLGLSDDMPPAQS